MRLLSVGPLLAAILAVGSLSGAQSSLRVDGERLLANLEELATFGATPEGGSHRVAYSDENLAARVFVVGLMEAADLHVEVDGVGNLIGRRPGSDPRLAPIVLGSHIDTVPQGGNYDGPVGSMGALEIAQTLADNRITTRHPLEFVVLQNEEGGKTGSRALIGIVAPHELDIVTASGKTIGEGIRTLGGDPTRLEAVRRQPGSVAAFLELHIEQGAILEEGGLDIGVVEGIVGIKRWNVTFEGSANHAGTTPMISRRDPLVAAARFIDTVNEVARTTPGRQVATVGRVEVTPGAPNVIPGEVTVSLEIRDLEMDKVDAVFEAIRSRAEAIAADTDVSVDLEQFYVSHEAPTDPRIRRLVSDAAEDLGLSSLEMPSGAGHDAQSMAALGPIGMVFIPSVGGISHSPREYSEPEAIVAGVNVLLHTLLKLDARGFYSTGAGSGGIRVSLGQRLSIGAHPGRDPLRLGPTPPHTDVPPWRRPAAAPPPPPPPSRRW